jgi:heme o synthase
VLPLGPQNPAPPTLQTPNSALAPAETASALLELAKPGVAGLVVVTTFCGALTAPVPIDFWRLTFATVGTAAVVASANALNMILERDTDALMRRTRLRPLPSGRLGVEAAVAFAIATAAIGLGILYLWVGELPALLSLIALASYVAAYTPLKRVTPLALFVGAVPGAMPPLIGWASATGSLDTLGWLLFGILFVWQLPHFLAIAIFRRDEYARAGHRVLPVVRGVPRTKVEMAVYSVALVAVSLLPVGLGLAGFAYAAVALVSGMVFLWLATAGFSALDDSRWARRVFFASMPYLVVVLGSLSAFSAL